jgi:hypothetical protein
MSGVSRAPSLGGRRHVSLLIVPVIRDLALCARHQPPPSEG